MSFTSLMESLTNKKSKGASVLIPELIIFESGKPKSFLYFDKTMSEVKITYNKYKLNIQHLMRIMSNYYREKRIHNLVNKTNTESHNTLPMVNVRFLDKKVDLTQGKFTQLMLERPTNKIWRDIVYIQNYVILSNNMPKFIKYIYLAPLNINNPREKVKYVCDEFGENTVERQCCIIAHYLSKIHLLVIIKRLI